MKKLRRFYVAGCVLAVHALLLLAAANGVALWFHLQRDRIQEQNPQMAALLDQQPELVRLIYPGHEPGEVREMLEEIWSLRPTYELFTQFKEEPFAGRWVHVDPHGFRHVAGQGPWPIDEGHHNVFVFGGSTTFGYGVADADTIPSHLQAALRARDGGAKPVSVYNFGRGGYYSSQERVLLEQLILAGAVPDVAVFVDGLNDFGSIGRERRYAETFRSLMASYTGDRFVSADLLATLPLAKVLGQRLDAAADEQAVATDPGATPEFVVRRYLDNKRMLEALCAAFGVEPLFVWQPVQHFEYDPPTVVQAVDVHGLGQDTYSRMRELHLNGQIGGRFLWLAELQMQSPHRQQLLYVDPFHYTSAFARAIAGAIAEAL